MNTIKKVTDSLSEYLGAEVKEKFLLGFIIKFAIVFFHKLNSVIITLFGMFENFKHTSLVNLFNTTNLF